MFEPWRDRRQRLWILRLPTGVDARVADLEGNDFRGQHIGRGWCLQPTSVGNGFGIASTIRLSPSDGLVSATPIPATPDDSDDSEAEVLMHDPTGPLVDDHFGHVVAQLRRHRGEDTDTPPNASRGSPVLPTDSAVSADPPEVVRVMYDNFEGTFPLIVSILEASAEIDLESPDQHADGSTNGEEMPSAFSRNDARDTLDSDGEVSLMQIRKSKGRAVTTLANREQAVSTPKVAVGETIPPVASNRAIATPCRNRPCRPGPPLSQARVEVATESPAPVAQISNARTLLLSELILPHPCVHKEAELHTNAKLEDLMRVLEPFGLDNFCRSFRLPEVHSATRAALAQMPAWEPQLMPALLHLYVDGSYFADTCNGGWAVVALAQQSTELAWVGYLSGRLYTAGHPCCMGQTCISPHTAELIALAYALAVAIQNPATECGIHYDATSAALIADVQASSKEQPVLMNALFVLRYIVTNLCQGVKLSHVYAHKGDPWNEAADTAAKAAAKYHYGHCPGAPPLPLQCVKEPLTGLRGLSAIMCMLVFSLA